MLAMAAEHGGHPDDPDKRASPRLRPLAAVAARRAVVGVAVGPGAARVAHRVLGAGPARAGGDHRRARRGARPGLPPPRVRDRPVGVGDRAALRPSLAARRPGRPRRHEDVQVARQPGLRRGPAEGVGAGGRPAGPARPPLPTRLGVDRRGHAAAGGDCERLAPRSAGGADDPAAGSAAELGRTWCVPRLDDDLDTPGALAALDDEAEAGRPVVRGATLLGVTL